MNSELLAYRKFIAGKFAVAGQAREFNASLDAPYLKEHQRACIQFALERGRSAMFLDTGLGKTLVELWFAKLTALETGKPSLILAPLAVGAQILREAKRFGIEARQARGGDEPDEGIAVCNYERLHLLDPSKYGAVVLDESGILKGLDGKTRSTLIDVFSNTEFKLCGTATPSPNDHMELGNHAEFLNVMRFQEMLSRWFINDTSTASRDWRLKRHAAKDFWRWVASWARCATLPSDLGGNDDGYILPEVIRNVHEVAADRSNDTDGMLFRIPEMSATSFHKEKRLTLHARCEKAAQLANSHDDPVLVWCETNAEGDLLEKLIPDAVQVSGKQDADTKERLLMGFVDGTHRVLVTKPKIAGHGLNFQHCAHVVFASISFSYEQYYQAIRRTHRFGQTRQVVTDVIVSDTEKSILDVINRKCGTHEEMKKSMAAAMAHEQLHARRHVKFDMHEMVFPNWLVTE